MRELDIIAGVCVKTAYKAASAADTVVENSKRKIEAMAIKNRMGKAQRQLGTLVYALHKRGEENTLLVKKYLDTISALDNRLQLLCINGIDGKVLSTCPRCGEELNKEASFCQACGAGMK